MMTVTANELLGPRYERLEYTRGSRRQLCRLVQELNLDGSPRQCDAFGRGMPLTPS